MDELTPPAIIGGPKELVPYVDHKRDAGTAWVRSLSDAQTANLVDLAGELAQTFSITDIRVITPRQFESKLTRSGKIEDLHSKLIRIVGYTAGPSTLYFVWWAWAWIYNYTRECKLQEFDEAARAATAEKMGLSVPDLTRRLARRDVSAIVNAFLVRSAKEMKGEIMFRTASEARDGTPKAMEMFYKFVATEEVHTDKASVIDPAQLSENQLMSEIAKMKKDLGLLADTVDAEVIIQDAEFDAG